jgi:uncharacterized membrane protein (DUF485 family)
MNINAGVVGLSVDPKASTLAGRLAAARIVDDPKFTALVRKRNGLAVTLSILTMAVYLAFIFLVAFDKPLLATKVGGGTTSLGIVFGLVVIVLAFVVTAIYVSAANGEYDTLTADLKREYDR